MDNVRKHRDIELVKTERRRNYLVSGPNLHTRKFFTENLFGIEMKKKTTTTKNKQTKKHINRPVYLGFSILELSKILIYDFWYDYVKPKYRE